MGLEEYVINRIKDLEEENGFLKLKIKELKESKTVRFQASFDDTDTDRTYIVSLKNKKFKVELANTINKEWLDNGTHNNRH